MRQIIPDLLWIGNAVDARDVKSVLSFGIRAVVDLAASEPTIQYPRDITYLRLPLTDGAGNEHSTLRLAITSTVELVRSQVPALVACSAGMSRSPAISAAAIALVERRPPDDVLLMIVSDGPDDVSSSLWLEIKQVVSLLDESLS